jgi:hypothetical protein
MNYDSTHIDHNESTGTTVPPVSVIADIVTKLRSWLQRSDLQKAQAHYRCKQQRQAHQPGVLENLPLRDKLRLGMHRWMD